MYNLQDNSIKEEGGKAVFPLGISENNELTSVEKGTADNGNVYLKFTFTHTPDGSTTSLFEWPVDSTKDNAEKKFKSQVTRVKHIMTKFVSEDQLPVASSFEEFVDKVVATLAGKTQGKALRMKTVVLWNDYTGIPPYVPFVEDQTVTKDASKLKITSFDKMERSNQDTTDDVTAQLSAPVASGASDENLPF